MAWEDWRDSQTAATWNAALGVLEEGARQFASEREKELRITVTSGRWDEPDVELRWGPGMTQRNIHMLIQGERYPLNIEFSAGAWEDHDRDVDGKITRERDSDSRVVRTRRISDLQELPAHLATDLEEAFKAASALVPRREPATSSAGASAD
jgi:hypothetical protein